MFVNRKLISVLIRTIFDIIDVYICNMFKAIFSKQNSRLKAIWERYDLVFKQPAKTSRETFKKKDTYILKLRFEDQEIEGLGECSPLWTLSIDPKREYSEKLDWVCANINDWKKIEKIVEQKKETEK